MQPFLQESLASHLKPYATEILSVLYPFDWATREQFPIANSAAAAIFCLEDEHGRQKPFAINLINYCLHFMQVKYGRL